MIPIPGESHFLVGEAGVFVKVFGGLKCKFPNQKVLLQICGRHPVCLGSQTFCPGCSAGHLDKAPSPKYERKLPFCWVVSLSYLKWIDWIGTPYIIMLTWLVDFEIGPVSGNVTRSHRRPQAWLCLSYLSPPHGLQYQSLPNQLWNAKWATLN